MSQTVAPPIPSLVPETAPFTAEQRAWLNGFFAGLVSLDGAGVTALSAKQSAALMPGGAKNEFGDTDDGDRKSTRLNSSHSQISYAVFCLKKKKKTISRA